MRKIDEKLLKLTVLFMAIFSFLAANIAIGSFLVDLDMRTMEWIDEARNLQLMNIFLFFSDLGAAESLFVLGIVALSALALFGRWRMMKIFFAANAGGEILYRILKVIVHRARPDENFSLVASSGYSFPSGHATESMIFYGILGYFLVYLCDRRWKKILIMSAVSILIFMIGISRLYLGVHWLTDVLGGWLFGMMMIFGTIFIQDRWAQRHLIKIRKDSRT